MNSILLINPYKCGNVWVFDDPNVGLVREPFVSGVPEIIDRMLASKGINGTKGFNLYFSEVPFPDSIEVNWVRKEFGGNWYSIQLGDEQKEGWLCPAMLNYFNKPPKTLYVRVEAIKK